MICLFVTLENSVLDYTTLAHEFGHFADNYVNNGADASIDLSEISSQALELLMLTKLEGKFNDDTAKYIKYKKLDDIFRAIIYQSFYASFEIEAYKLDYDEITVENLNKIVAENAKKFGFSSDWNSVDYVMVSHLFIYPFYVQSYGTSAVASLEIYATELESAGAGFEIYKNFLSLNKSSAGFLQTLSDAGLSSPFDEQSLKTLMNELCYLLLGSNFYPDAESNAS